MDQSAEIDAGEHLWLSDLRKHPRGTVRLYDEHGRLISGTYAYQVTASIDARVTPPGEPCPMCDGYGVLDGLEACPECRGRRYVTPPERGAGA